MLVIDRPKHDKIRVKSIGGKTVIQEYRPYGKSRGGKRKTYIDITSSLNPGEFYRAAVEGNLDLPKNASIQLVIGDNAPFNRIFHDAESASYYLANFLGIDVPENYKGPIMEPKSDDIEELIPLIQITIY